MFSELRLCSRARVRQQSEVGLYMMYPAAPVYLGDGVDPCDVCEDVRPPRGVVHDRLDAAEGGRVDGGLRAVPVQPRQQVKQTGEALAGDRWIFRDTDNVDI